MIDFVETNAARLRRTGRTMSADRGAIGGPEDELMLYITQPPATASFRK
jgi:hypothetical protein